MSPLGIRYLVGAVIAMIVSPIVIAKWEKKEYNNEPIDKRDVFMFGLFGVLVGVIWPLIIPSFFIYLLGKWGERFR